MRRYISTILLISLLVITIGNVHSVTRANMPPATTRRWSQDDVDSLVEGNTAFAFDLYQIIRSENENLIFSPFSISLAVGMLYGGARGETAQQIADTLHFPSPEEAVHSGFDALQERFVIVDEPEEEFEPFPFQLRVANALWGQDGYPFNPDYLMLLNDSYRSELRMMDFSGEPDESRVIINDWVSEQTEDRINDLLAPGSVTSGTRMILVNAIYFKAAWTHLFDAENTTDMPFTLLDGSEISVPMMSQTKTYIYTQGDNYQTVELSYQDDRLAMMIVLPDLGELEAVEESLDAEWFETVRFNPSEISSTRVTVSIPLFTYESDFNLGETLSDMGMPDAFNPSVADFSGIAAGDESLALDFVVHKAFIDVNEQGTEAAAATALGLGGCSDCGPVVEPIIFTVDHPFIYLIYDRVSGTILFMGRVLNPAE